MSQEIMGYTSGELRNNTLEVDEKKAVMVKDEIELPDELVLTILEALTDDILSRPDPLSRENLKPLCRSSQISRQYCSLACECFQRIFTKLAGEVEIKTDMSWIRAVGLLSNFHSDTHIVKGRKGVLEAKDPIEHLAVSGVLRDKIEMGSTRYLLNKDFLVALEVEKLADGKEKCKLLWKQKMTAVSGKIFVSDDRHFIATQHIQRYKTKAGNEGFINRFDVRKVKTGELLGAIKINCPNLAEPRAFEPSEVSFDLERFQYQQEGMVKSHYFDPAVIAENAKGSTQSKLS